MFGLQQWDWFLYGWITAAGVLCAVSGAILGNFLVLRRMSLLGDAISHAVLPGLAGAFFLTGSRSSLPMFCGAVVVGVMTAVFTEWIRKAGKVDEGASMGVVFTSLFALGLVMMKVAHDLRYIDLDPDCVLYGAIVSTPMPQYMWRLAGMDVPRVVVVLSVVVLINLLFVIVFYKELKISTFDPGLATTTGFSASFMHYLLMILVAVTAVACFESVGSILVVAMFIVPPATAYMLTDRLAIMILLSCLLGALAAVLGVVATLVVPAWFGYRTTRITGMMAVAAGLLFLLAVLFSPRYGVLVRLLRQKILAWRIFAEDVLALLYRIEERHGRTAVTPGNLRRILMSGRVSMHLILLWQRFAGLVYRQDNEYGLTDEGRKLAVGLVRSHRLWERYLAAEAGLSPTMIHGVAENLEHFTDKELRRKLDEQMAAPQIDPHGSPIPSEAERTTP